MTVLCYCILISNKIQQHTCTLMRVIIQNSDKQKAVMHYVQFYGTDTSKHVYA